MNSTKNNGKNIDSKQVIQDHSLSSNSVEPPKDLKKRWQTPKNVKGLASQANMVATLVLNGEIDIDTARSYSAIIRTVAQAVTNETNKSRFLKSMPDLEFEDDIFEEGE
jgi:hypothetical protein